MGYLAVLGALFGFVALQLTFKLGGRRGCSASGQVLAVFGLCALAALAALLATGRVLPVRPAMVGYGLLCGAIGAGGSLAFAMAVRLGHYGYSAAFLAMSFVIPSLSSVIVRGAAMNATTWAGLALVAMGVLCLSLPERGVEGPTGKRGRWLLVALATMVLNGLVGVVQEAGTHAAGYDRMQFLFFIYAAGGVILALATARHANLDRKTFVYGAAGAAGSVLGIFCQLAALEILPGVQVFPVTLGGPLILGLVFSVLLFGERVGLRGGFGAVAGAMGVVLLSLR